MADAAKVRLVRCPKCENLLPELPDFSLYQCGGCGAILSAEKKGNSGAELSEVNVNEVKGSGHFEGGNMLQVLEDDMETGQRKTSTVGRSHTEGIVSHGSSTSQAGRRDMLHDSDNIVIGQERMRRIQTNGDQYELYAHGRNRGKNSKSDPTRPPCVTFHEGAPRESLRSDDYFYRNGEQSSYDIKPSADKGEWTRYPGHAFDEFSRFGSMGNSRAELLRKLDDLKDQIARTCDVSKSEERIYADPYGRHNIAAYVHEGLTSFPGANKQPDRRSQFAPYMDRYGSRDSYPRKEYPNEFLHYPGPDPSIPETIQGQSHLYQAYHDGFPGYYGDANRDLFVLHQHENFFHQPACSCVHCYEKSCRMPLKVDPPGLHNRRSRNGACNPSFLNLDSIPLPPMGSGCGSSSLYPLHTRKPLNDLDFGRHGRGRVSHPIRRGAPFITCGNCFEILKLSRRHMFSSKNEQKMKCGACSSIILFEFVDKGFVTSVSSQINRVSAEIDRGSNCADLNECSSDFVGSQCSFAAVDQNSNSGRPQKQLDHHSSTSSLYDEVESPKHISSGEHGFTAAKFLSTEVKTDLSSQECTGRSPEEDIETISLENYVEETSETTKHGFPAAKLLSTKVETDLSPQECIDHSPEEVIVRQGSTNQTRPEKESVSFDITNSQEEYADETAVTTEISSDSYLSQDSLETRKGHQQKVSRGGSNSFFAALFKKGFRELRKSSRGADVGKWQVFVNGHLMPDHAVRKAERLAGTIQPGDYWYDTKAGFWGVMGHPCLGVIMPNIEEFNYPMPKNCSAGDTAVFVNGRELNQRDLNLLAKRGLPITRNRSYVINIIGEVVDVRTGEELDGLGKLAPTVQRVQHGFGMRVPRFIAQPKELNRDGSAS